MSWITTHILDTSKGKPAKGVPVILEQLLAGRWKKLGQAKTNADGRVLNLAPSYYKAKKGTYRITFQTGVYFKAQKTQGFYPYATITFIVHNTAQHYHVPLLLSPFGYSTYRGS